MSHISYDSLINVQLLEFFFLNYFQRLNALSPLDEKQDGNMRTAISAEAIKKPGANLPVIPKDKDQRECIESALSGNTFMRNLSKDQFNKVNIMFTTNYYFIFL